MTEIHQRRAGRDPLLLLFGGLIGLVGVLLAAGGGWLAVLGGSWYYLIAGVGLLIAGVLLARRRRSGAGWFAAVFVGTLIWAAWESGLNYWRWIPRLDVVLILAIIVALLLPRLGGFSRGASRGLAGVLFLGLAAAGVLAFVPYGYVNLAEVPEAQGQSLETDVGSAQHSDAPQDGDWAAYGRNAAATRYSPLDQINADNVGKLERAWQYRTGDLLDHRWGAETTPLKIGNSVYLCTSRNILIGLDASSGKELWRFDPKVPDEAIPYTAACRGVSYYEVPQQSDTQASADTQPTACQARVISGTLDGRIIAVDAKTGEPCADFGDNGQVDIKTGMGVTPEGYVSINSPPVIVRNVIVTGHQVLDGQRVDPPSGVIKGFDAVTGELKWAWDAARPDQSAPLPEGETYTRGSPNMWTIASGDDKLGMVYLPMANAAADYWSSSRTPEVNEWSVALVALNVETGLPAWKFQTTHKDVWDYDLGSQPSLVDFPTDKGLVPAVVLPSKQGDIYVFDRRTGEPLFDIEERAVPQGGAEPEQRSPTQPFSTYHTLRKPDLTDRDMWGMTPFDQLACRIQFQQASYEGIYTPPTPDRPSIEYPSYNGGSDWGSVAIDTQRGVIIANYNDMPNHVQLVPRADADRMGWKPREELVADRGGAEGAGDPQAGTPYAINVNAGWRLKYTGLLCKQPPYGGIRAIDLKSGETLWDRPLGTARGNGPWNIRSGLPIDIGTPNNGGSVVTAGGLIFIAAATDDLIRAIDIKTGKTVWEDVLPAGGQANPLVYEANGRQYLMIVAAGHHFMETPTGDYVITYALPQ
ncbi:membrane-bound PQQ-dependent dehydrogenase, glucose/quinate/shikimate family [Pseudomonas daroniae]|uniref:Membrane-bound PQQ-dependent dehydrogenase, glucose/quinate/shikimate family n=1 Tax=Phytopseudomonas daroniae TaxID=2487519 RepID=A0A4Q9QRH1_9GAMM|nr:MULTISPECIES: membrane-bound PQQ-dependent dehydrogenase, glucose/quinate/shikimate family [Pseudomonas]TBU83475.1 membrane-bound PQQ-dependent dehydrogenase, glucose/quinate/shikimate family [Pseudomonas daroniae]TBU85114.1 membrane-bound PQQ-dependent dehydrogenase, glucose/quinate/shikimate family [Pseudomonas sp. FRB 228]TBU93593.1 membrane-bound PQQ-dependent dehydrogenase, glucose/quinate/shikimate family [Pseudomonas daroniae]